MIVMRLKALMERSCQPWTINVDNEPHLHVYKKSVVLVGGTNVGKITIPLRYVHNTTSATIPSIGEFNIAIELSIYGFYGLASPDFVLQKMCVCVGGGRKKEPDNR